MTVFTGFLIHALYKAEERSARLKQTRRTNVGAGPPGGLQQQQQVQHLQVQSPPSPPIGKHELEPLFLKKFISKITILNK